MTKVIVTTAVVMTFLCACSSNNGNSSGEQSVAQTTISNISDFTKSFEGTINGKFGIIMTLTKNAKSLSGTYSYKSKGIPIKVSGNLDDKGNLTINEFNDNGSMTGVFKGQLSGINIIGNWEKPDGSKIMSFSISESVDKEISIATNQSQSDSKQEILNNLVGEYKLNAISYFAGANTMGDYGIENGKWIANELSNHGGQREGYDIKLTAVVLQKLK